MVRKCNDQLSESTLPFGVEHLCCEIQLFIQGPVVGRFVGWGKVDVVYERGVSFWPGRIARDHPRHPAQVEAEAEAETEA